jgi:hypothetical protein
MAPSITMNRRAFLTLAGVAPAVGAAAPARRTEVSIRGEQFFLNGQPTYAGRSYQGLKIEGLLMNMRAVQGIFDDLNPQTRGKWAYSDTGQWDPERNTRELVAALPQWRPMPVLINEDGHFRFDQPENHMMTALAEHVSWGYFDPGASNYADGYQCPPVNWGINTERKRQFFAKLKEVTGA